MLRGSRSSACAEGSFSVLLKRQMAAWSVGVNLRSEYALLFVVLSYLLMFNHTSVAVTGIIPTSYSVGVGKNGSTRGVHKGVMTLKGRTYIHSKLNLGCAEE